MKFAHDFREALKSEGFPPHWLESAIPYSQLKKCIKKVEGELQSLGLDLKTLSQLNPQSRTTKDGDASRPHGQSRGQESAVAFQYSFTDKADDTLRPTLTLFIQLEDGITIDAALSAATRNLLKPLIAGQSKSIVPRPSVSPRLEKEIGSEILMQDGAGSDDSSLFRQVEVPLTFDDEFFGLLQEDVSSLHALREVEERTMVHEIQLLGSDVARLATPSSRKGKSDLSQWREVFDLYLQAGVFFSTHELDYGRRRSAVALRQLQWFQKEVTGRGLAKSFRFSASRESLERFSRINFALLQNVKFQEMNQLAVSKILKKFDKRTSLGAKSSVSKLLGPNISEAMGKAVCARLSSEIIKVVPQLDDYLCPICYNISYKPVRLACGHVFCIRCMIQMQRSRADRCPLCRSEVILTADSANLDLSLMNFLRAYFPRETRAKQKENEHSAAVDAYGEHYKDARCYLM